MTEPSEPTKAAIAFMEAVRLYWDEWASRSDENQTLRKVATFLCKRDGRDPNGVVIGVPGAPVIIDAKGCAAISAPFNTNWSAYLLDAQNSLDLFKEVLGVWSETTS